MKKEDFIKRLSEMTGISTEKIVENITSEKDEIEDIVLKDTNNEGQQVDITLNDLVIFKPSELSKRLINHVETSKKTIIEQAIKAERNKLKEKYGIDFEGKTIENLVKYSLDAGKKEAGTKPNEKIQELEGTIETLRGNIKSIEEQKEQEIEKIKQEAEALKLNTGLLNIIPDNLDTPLSKKDLSILLKSDYDIKIEEGKRVYYQDGVKQVDPKTQSPLSDNEIVSKFLEMKKIVSKSEEGRNLDNDFGKVNKLEKIKNTEDFYNYCKTNNIPDKDRYKILQEVQKENPEFALE